MIKKLIVPIVIGLVMFGAAFGGAFYYYNSQEARAAAKVQSVVDQALADLKKQGRTTAFTARLLAVVGAPKPAAPVSIDDGQGKSEGTGAVVAAKQHPVTALTLLLPGTVHYDMDFNALKKQDAVWHADKKTLSVRLPRLILTEPEFVPDDIRILSANGTPSSPEHGQTALDKESLKGAQGQLLQQAREDGPMDLARDISRKMVTRAFAVPLQAAGIKVKVDVRFADEAKDGAGQEFPIGGENSDHAGEAN